MIQEPLTKSGLSFANRFVVQPMEGCDCNADGSPTELTEKKYMSFAGSGAGLIWLEATAVCPEGRTNPRQMMLTEENLPAYVSLLRRMREVSERRFGCRPVILLQLTHSGRQSIEPLCAYHNAVYEEKRPIGDERIVSDAYLDTLPALYAKTAVLAERAGFDGVDVKSCHGYLFQELLSAYSRPGRYGGSFENRFRLYRDAYDAVKAAVAPGFIVATRFDPCDMVPKPNGFGTDEENHIDLTEAKEIIRYFSAHGLRLMNITLGNPYYNPHVNRPFRKGAYTPPETPETGLRRFTEVETELSRCFPEIVFVGSGFSYYRDDLFERAEEALRNRVCDLVGFGRESIAYPDCYTDYLKGEFQVKKACLSCSKCTELMRAHQVSGCAVFNETYRELYRKVILKK